MKRKPVKRGGAFALAMAMLLSLILALPAVGNIDLLNGYGGYQIPDPSIDIEKYVSVDDGNTWQDADTPPGPEVLAGSETVWFRFIVTNDGDVSLTNVTLSDTDFEVVFRRGNRSALKRGRARKGQSEGDGAKSLAETGSLWAESPRGSGTMD